MLLVDANVILRFILNDHPEMSSRAKEILVDNETLILTQVVAEVIYVLDGVYASSRQKTASVLNKVFSLPKTLIENRSIVTLALDEYAKTKLDFVDTLLYAYHRITGLSVETFDKDLQRALYAGSS